MSKTDGWWSAETEQTVTYNPSDKYVTGQRIKLRRGSKFYQLRKRIEIWWKFKVNK